MRCFIGIDVPKSIKDNLFGLRKTVPGNIAKINWVSKKNFHITLKFLGEIDEDKADDIMKRLNNIKFKPFCLRLNSLGFFLFAGKPRIIRLNFMEEEGIIKLQRRIDEELLNISPKDQKFSPHLTLGRIKFIKKKKEFLEKIKQFEITNEKFEVNNFKLIQSKLTKDGPKYYVLKEFKA
jgi:2'-5' RNA ligase